MFTHKDITQVENFALYFTPKVTYFQCLSGEHLFLSDPRLTGMLNNSHPVGPLPEVHQAFFVEY